MEYRALSAELRDVQGTRECRELRRGGKLPAVVYGGKDGDGKPNRETKSIVVNRAELETMIHEGVRFVDLDLGGQVANTVIKDLQWATLDDHLLHADFMRIDLAEPVEVNVPVAYKGSAAGEKKGGRVFTRATHVKLRGLPRELPEQVVARLEPLDVDKPLRAASIDLAGAELISRKDEIIAEIRIKRAGKKSKDDEAEAEATEEGAGEEG